MGLFSKLLPSQKRKKFKQLQEYMNSLLTNYVPEEAEAFKISVTDKFERVESFLSTGNRVIVNKLLYEAEKDIKQLEGLISEYRALKEEITSLIADIVGKDALTNLANTEETLRAIAQGNEKLIRYIKEVRANNSVIFFNENFDAIKTVGIIYTFIELNQLDNVYRVVTNGIVSQSLVNVATKKGAKYIIGRWKDSSLSIPNGVAVLTFSDLEGGDLNGVI